MTWLRHWSGIVCMQVAFIWTRARKAGAHEQALNIKRYGPPKAVLQPDTIAAMCCNPEGNGIPTRCVEHFLLLFVHKMRYMAHPMLTEVFLKPATTGCVGHFLRFFVVIWLARCWPKSLSTSSHNSHHVLSPDCDAHPSLPVPPFVLGQNLIS